MKNIILLFLIPFVSFSQNEELCDSINIDFIGYNIENNHFEIDVNTEYTTPYWFGYCGFMITTNEGDTIAAENINTAGNVYGLGNNMNETRYLEILEENFNFSINGEIHLVEGFFAGNGTIACSYPFVFNCNDTDNNGFCDEEDIPNLTYVPDDNFEQYFITIGIDDVLDDYIPTDMASEVTQMLVSNLGIEDLTGIEDCINIVYLDCSANNLLELNISNNIALDQLHCYSNNLTELNIQNNTDLKVLTCSFNSLSTLDISNNNLLTSLACSDNMISELDISSQIDLEYLDCHQNNLSELNITNNTKLETLTCSFNNLSELNVITNTDLTQLALENNNILELDVTNNTELYYLDCSFNDITELDISNNTDLNNMFCNNNNLSCIQVWDINYAENYFIKDDDAIWSLDCEYGIGLAQNSKNKTLLKHTDMLGRLSATKGFTLKMYDDGSVEKKYIIK